MGGLSSLVRIIISEYAVCVRSCTVTPPLTTRYRVCLCCRDTTYVVGIQRSEIYICKKRAHHTWTTTVQDRTFDPTPDMMIVPEERVSYDVPRYDDGCTVTIWSDRTTPDMMMRKIRDIPRYDDRSRGESTQRRTHI